MIAHLHRAGSGRTGPRRLLVMLPGAGIDATEFADQGMVAALHARGLNVDVVVVQPTLDLYLDGSIVEALHREIGEHMVADGYAGLWLLGVSLGAMGALLHASHYAAHLEGLVLLAPFLGTQGTIAAIGARGGFATAAAEDAAISATERTMLAWLGDFLRRSPNSPALYLGYGEADRFAAGHRLLAGSLPAHRVVTTAGGHDWGTWLALWQSVLDKAPFAAGAERQGRVVG